jgi:hypothetical protein
VRHIVQPSGPVCLVARRSRLSSSAVHTDGRPVARAFVGPVMVSATPGDATATFTSTEHQAQEHHG